MKLDDFDEECLRRLLTKNGANESQIKTILSFLDGKCYIVSSNEKSDPSADNSFQFRDKPMMKVWEVAELTHMSERNIRNIAKKGLISKVYATGTKRCIGYSTSSVMAYLDARR